MSRTLPSIRFPGESTWEIWRYNRSGVWELAPAAALDEKVALHGIQAQSLDSSPFWQMAGDAEHVSKGIAEAADVALLRWEALGVSDEAGARQSALWPVLQQPHRVLVASVAISSDCADDASLALKADDYQISALMLPLPQDGVALWRELGRTVAAFTREGQLMHVTLLSAPHLDGEALEELRSIVLALDAQEFLGKMATALLWVECDEGFTRGLEKMLGSADVHVQPRPAPAMPRMQIPGLIPIEVAQQRSEHLRRMRLMQMAAAAAAVFVIVFSVWAALLLRRESRLAASEALLRASAPQVQAVSEAQQAWQALEPAVNPDFYPSEVYHQILSMIPPSGLRLDSFDFEDMTVKLSGVVSDNPTFFDFRDKLTNNAALSRYEWSGGNPDQNLGFSITGTMTIGGAQ